MSLAAAAATVAVPSVWACRDVSSAAVRAWTPPTLPGKRVGPLYARDGGSGDDAVELLRGLLATGDVFGGAFDEPLSGA